MLLKAVFKHCDNALTHGYWYWDTPYPQLADILSDIQSSGSTKPSKLQINPQFGLSKPGLNRSTVQKILVL